VTSSQSTIASAPAARFHSLVERSLAPRRVDRLFEPAQLNEFEVVLFRVSGIGNILEAVTPDVLSDQRRARLDETMRVATSFAAERQSRGPGLRG
jgi:hypothetical protein